TRAGGVASRRVAGVERRPTVTIANLAAGGAVAAALAAVLTASQPKLVEAQPLASTIVAPAVFAQAHDTCASLAALRLPDTTVQKAEEVPGPSFAGGEGPPLTNLPPFCRVAAVTTPAVNFEVWLPLNGWNGKFQTV